MLSIQFLLSFAWRLTIGSFCDGHPYRRKCQTPTVSPAKPGDYLLDLVSESALRRPVEAPRIAWTALKTLAKGGMVVADREILRTALYTFVSHTLATKPLQQRIPTL
jgi:hypothetical protein